MPSENLSFILSRTEDSKSTLVDDTYHTLHLDQYLSGNMTLPDFDQSSTWQIPAAFENINANDVK